MPIKSGAVRSEKVILAQPAFLAIFGGAVVAKNAGLARLPGMRVVLRLEAYCAANALSPFLCSKARQSKIKHGSRWHSHK